MRFLSVDKRPGLMFAIYSHFEVYIMKKLFLSLLLGACVLPLMLYAANTTLEDTSLVRISTAAERADFLSQMMRSRLGLNNEEFVAIQAINLKYEDMLQELTLANSSVNNAAFGLVKRKPSRGDSPFDQLSEAREKEVKKALSNRTYREYDKQRWGMRTMLKKQMLANKEERARIEREQRIALEKARADSIAAAQAALEKKASKKGSNKGSQKKVTKKPAKKKR
jgi:hypothetical protein